MRNSHSILAVLINMYNECNSAKPGSKPLVEKERSTGVSDYVSTWGASTLAMILSRRSQMKRKMYAK